MEISQNQQKHRRRGKCNSNDIREIGFSSDKEVRTNIFQFVLIQN